MAEYVPFLSQKPDPEEHGLRNRVLGCFGCGGLGVLGFFGVLVLLVGGLGTGTSSCEIGTGDPGKGTASKRLDVAVSPRTELADGTTVRVTSTSFAPWSVVGVAVCLRSADTDRRGVDACAEDQGARFATDAAGRLDATYAVPREIAVGGRTYDCAAKAERCIVVAADASDYDESGGQTITFRSGLPAPDLAPPTGRPLSVHLPIGSQPTVSERPLAPKTPVQVLASGFQPGEPLLVAFCSDDLEQTGMVASCDPLDTDQAITALMSRSVDADFPTANKAGAFATTLELRRTIHPFGTSFGTGPTNSGSSSSTTAARPSSTVPGATTTTPLRETSTTARCTVAGGGCSIVVAAAADLTRSAVLPYTVTG